jgi:hypothetical protein
LILGLIQKGISIMGRIVTKVRITTKSFSKSKNLENLVGNFNNIQIIKYNIT